MPPKNAAQGGEDGDHARMPKLPKAAMRIRRKTRHPKARHQHPPPNPPALDPKTKRPMRMPALPKATIRNANAAAVPVAAATVAAGVPTMASLHQKHRKGSRGKRNRSRRNNKSAVRPTS